MKKYLFIMAQLTIGLMLTVSCGSDDDGFDDTTPPSAQETNSYLTIDNATYSEGNIPQATTDATTTAQVSSTIQAGGKTVIRVAKDRVYTKFFIGIKGKTGYWTYSPITRATFDEGDDFYDIPFTAGSDVSGSIALQVNGETEDGDVTQPYEQTIVYTEQPTVRLKSVIAYINGQAIRNIMSFTYNSQGKVTSFFITGDDEMIIDYDGNRITSMVSRESDGDITYEVSQNERGFITRMEGNSKDYYNKITYTYDSQGHLTHISNQGLDLGDPFTSEASFTWSDDGNMIGSEIVTTDEDGDETQICSYTYGDYENKYRQPFSSITFADGYPAGIGLFGVGTTNLPIKAVSDGDTYTYSYTFNEDGSIKTQTITKNNSQTIDCVYSY